MLFSSKRKNLMLFLVVLFVIGFSSLAFTKAIQSGSGSKRLDIFHYHNVGNIWMRISNYGFFGSGDDVTPQWPSLEYPGGSGIDYLYQGALWFGACKQRRNSYGDELYWQNADQDETGTTNVGFGRVIDTLVSVGFDGDADMYEYLPAYNQLEENALGSLYDENNLSDGVLESSIREQQMGIDDDGDGLIDEDPAGFAFPYRHSVPSQFSTFSSGTNEFHGEVDSTQCDVGEINDNIDIWFPLGFLDLGFYDTDSLYNFARPQDDDGDGLQDEDGYPLSEQDYLGYYYDYSPFGTSGERTWGSGTGQEHKPLNVRVRQVSFQWSYEYIKNLIYVEFDITNMNPLDTLYDCAMGIYMDCDVGPQSWGGDPRSLEDISSYVSGEGYEFAYTYDADQDGGLTTGYIGARVCTPDPDQLDFACWTWKRGDGPHDGDPNTQDNRNQKYWLLTDRNPDDNKFTSLRDEPETQESDPCDTRFLFGFCGNMKGLTEPDTASWNLAPYETMKIVIGIFPGESPEEIKRTSEWSKIIYGEAQTLTTVILPDTFKHYEAPGPPDYPKMTCQQSEDGDSVFVYWDNRSEFTVDRMNVTKGAIGWQEETGNNFLDSYIDNYDEQLEEYGYFPAEFAPWDTLSNGEIDYTKPINRNDNASVNPWTADRLRHDFQGYTLWKRSKSGLEGAWTKVGRWDKIDTPQDFADYSVCQNLEDPTYEVNFGGFLGINNGLPQSHIVDGNDIVYGDTTSWTNYYRFDDLYSFTKIAVGDTVYGTPLYNTLDSIDVIAECTGVKEQEALLFKNPNPNISDELFLALYDDALIPLDGHLGQSHPQGLTELKEERLSRRYYKYTIEYPDKGVENYISVTTFDRGIPDKDLQSLESGKDANMKTIFPGPAAKNKMDNIYVVPNPYLGQSKFDGRRANDDKGDRSKRIWFVNLPENCTIKIFTLAGDLVDKIEHNGAHSVDVINPSKASPTGISASGIHEWDMLSRYDQIIASGIYLYSVEDHDSGYRKVDKFVIIK